MTKNSMAAAVMAELGEDTNDATVVSVFEQWVQNIYEDLLTRCLWTFQTDHLQLSLTASTTEYTLDANVQQILSARINGTDTLIEWLPYEALMKMGLDWDSSGPPKYLYDRGYNTSTDPGKLNVGVFPIPATSYTVDIHCILGPSQLATGDTLNVPLEFNHIIMSGVRFMAFTHDKDFNSAALWKQEYEQGIAQKKKRWQHRSAWQIRSRVQDLGNTSGTFFQRWPAGF